MYKRTQIPLFLLIGVLGCAVLGLVARQAELVGRVQDLERDLVKAKRVRTGEAAPVPRPPLTCETVSPAGSGIEAPQDGSNDPENLKATIQELRDALAKVRSARDAEVFPRGRFVWIGDEDLGLTSEQVARISVLEKRRDEELAVFDGANLPIDQNRIAFRKEIVDRHRLLIRQELDPLQQSKFDSQWYDINGEPLQLVAEDTNKPVSTKVTMAFRILPRLTHREEERFVW